MVKENYWLHSLPQAKSGDYEVHKESCNWLPNPENRIDLGEHYSCDTAVSLAKQKYPDYSDKIDGCIHCCLPCHHH